MIEATDPKEPTNAEPATEAAANVDLNPYLDAVAGFEGKRLELIDQLVEVCPCGEIGRRIHTRAEDLGARLDALKIELDQTAKDDERKDVAANLEALLAGAAEDLDALQDRVLEATDLPEDEKDARDRLVVAVEDIARSLAFLLPRADR